MSASTWRARRAALRRRWKTGGRRRWLLSLLATVVLGTAIWFGTALSLGRAPWPGGGAWPPAWLSARAEQMAPALASPVSLWSGVDLEALSHAITEMDVARARELVERYQTASLSVEQSQRLGIERARLGLYVGDCDSAEAILSSLPPEEEQVTGLRQLAQRCAGAVAASRVVEDVERGIWLRLQDADDEPLAPYIVDVADRAREAVRLDLGVELPRPLRIDVVRDLFSLSAISGLPLEAAETTGTVAVARWGRVTLLSPRAARHGYPWEDTMAHELVHLALSRATRDFAPLWLQEGVAKRQEQRWREPRPFDDAGSHDFVAQRALLTGSSVGVDKLGPSIAMLPSADAASVAFSEVTSFISFWIERNGRAAFRLLLADLKGLSDRDPGPALRSVSGYGLSEWIVLWQAHLRTLEEPAKAQAPQAGGGSPDMRSVRLGDLLFRGQHYAAAARRFDAAARGGPVAVRRYRLDLGRDPGRDAEQQSAPAPSALRYRQSQAELGANHPEEAAARLGELEEIDGAHAGWFALRGRFEAAAGDAEAAARSSRMALSLDPWSELVACEGHLRGLLGADPWELPEPADPTRRRLCLMARARPPVQ